ncbi:hypothetical protein C5O19_11230 [Siphonobacter curvatus]|uniref:Uncharacterized protein n=1 Tax=Siphonobacter curvatus TaxID=2094562 RepID=A0A2S7IR68_9BACT|nr:hypothetical protein C5O19_11230 [Siphonobacter curvatus]
MCNYELAWIGKCKDLADESGYCPEHAEVKCKCCGEKATRDCSETFMGFVCGEPLCNTCEHELTEKGVNYCGGRHVKQGEQKYKPWFMQESSK